jgi:hypothetical protein
VFIFEIEMVPSVLIGMETEPGFLESIVVAAGEGS